MVLNISFNVFHWEGVRDISCRHVGEEIPEDNLHVGNNYRAAERAGMNISLPYVTHNTQRRTRIMKKTLKTIGLAVFVVLMTATFGFAEYKVTGVSDFPYFQLGCLIVGGMTIISLKHKYQKMYTGELMGVFTLYTILIALFTAPVINTIKALVS
jgi:FtsH-binding integral membrane protein